MLRARSTLPVAASLFLLANSLACGSDSPATRGACVLETPEVAAYRDWPGGGHELWVRVGCQDGKLATSAASITQRLKVEPKGKAQVETAQTASPGPGLTLVVMRPSAGSTEHMRALAEAFIAQRPAEERIALYGWGDELVQLSDFRSARATLSKLLPRLDRLRRDGQPAQTTDTLQELLARVAHTGGQAQHGLRSLLVISDSALEIDELPAGSRSQRAVETLWALPETKGLGDAALRWNEDSDPQQLADALSARLDAVTEHGFAHVAVCGDGSALTLKLRSGENSTELPLRADESAASAAACDTGDILKGRRSPVDTLTVTLDATGEPLYQARLAELQRLVKDYDLSTPLGQFRLLTEGYGTGKDDFPAQVSLSSGYGELPAKAHLRGQGAAFCPRPSLSVNLDEHARYFSETSAIDEFYLIAGCEDPGLYGYLGDVLYREQDIFPLEFHFVELVFPTETRGVYVWMEQREQKLKTAHAALRGTVRRRYERFVKAEIDSVIAHDDALKASYEALLGSGVPDEKYAAYLDERLEVDGYLRWIALNALLMNSDSQDESVFVATESIAEDGSPTDYFHFTGWDPQTIFLACAPNSTGRVPDKHGLTYCQTSELDVRVLGNPELYARYVEVLRQVLRDTDEAKLKSIIAAARAELTPLLERAGVAAAMNVALPPDIANPWHGVTDAASAQAHLDAVEAEMLKMFRAQRATLQANLDRL